MTSDTPARVRRAKMSAMGAVCLALACCVSRASGVGGVRAEENIDRSCMVSRSQLPEWRSAKGLMIVDTRAPEEFRKVRIRDSINVPPHALKVKNYLKSKPVLLIGRAGSGAELEPVCRILRDVGFASVGILEGGVNVWAHDVGGMVGDDATHRVSSGLSAADISREPHPDDWIVVDTSLDGWSRSGSLWNTCVRVPFRGDPDFRRELRDVLAVQEHDRPPFVLLVDGAGDRDERLEEALHGVNDPNLFFLRGGFEGYRRYAARWASIGRTRERIGVASRCGSR